MDSEEAPAEGEPQAGGARTGEPSAGGESRAGRNLPAAVVVGFILFALVVATFVFWPPGTVILMAILGVLGTMEIRHALRRTGMNADIVPVAVGTAAIVLAAYAAALWPGQTWETVKWAVLGVTIVGCLIWRMPAGADGYARDAAANVFIVGYVGVLAAFTGPLIAMPSGVWKLATVFLCVVGSDTGGYILGATLGKHPMAPKVSPKKTWEGMVGSVILAGVLGVLMAIFVLQRAWWFGLGLAVVIVVFGTLGDLIESMIKRDVGIKDMSSVLPGHGGVMERLDSMLVAIPVGWLVFSLPL